MQKTSQQKPSQQKPSQQKPSQPELSREEAKQKEAERKRVFAEAMGRLIAAYDRDGGSALVNNHQVSLYEVEPRLIWDHLAAAQLQACTVVVPVDYRSTPRPPNHVRFVCISDTHSLHEYMPEIPNGDVLLHAGDFSMNGRPDEVDKFSRFLQSMPHPHKIVIAGNHELTFHRESYPTTARRNGGHAKQFSEESTKGALKHCTYLEDAACTVSGGLTVYGSPWQPEFCGWAFNLNRGPELRTKWATIGLPAEAKGGDCSGGGSGGDSIDSAASGGVVSGSSGSVSGGVVNSGGGVSSSGVGSGGGVGEIDVLMTHGPPLGFGDRCFHGDRAGCYDLLKRVQQLRPKFHVFGHIHEGYGQFQDSFGNAYINASIVNETYNRFETHRPIVFDLPCRPGFTNNHPLEPSVITQAVPARRKIYD